MEIQNYKKRIVDEKIDYYLTLFGATIIDGPKYSGKTWAARKHAKSETLLYKNTGDYSNIVELAKISPEIILEGEKPKLIGEWQEATNLWDEIRYEIDKTGLKGQYILPVFLTPKNDGISRSKALRFGKIHLRTMSLYESGDSSGGVSLKDICDGKSISKATVDVSIRKLAYLIIRGGFPANIDYSSCDASKMVKEYIDRIIEDDVSRIDGVKRDKHKISLLLRSLARNESTTVTNMTLKNDIKDNDYDDIDTIASYLAVLEKLYLLDNDKPFSNKIRSSARIKQAEKRHFADPSIACALLNLTEDKLINDLETFGFLFEAMVERDLKVYADSFDANCFHYQDYLNREIDAVIEFESGDWCAFEIKLGTNAIDKAADNLIKIRDSIKESGGRAPTVLCVVCGLSSAAYQRPDDVYVVPITALRN